MFSNGKLIAYTVSAVKSRATKIEGNIFITSCNICHKRKVQLHDFKILHMGGITILFAVALAPMPIAVAQHHG
jgi:hypothetical protein